jgi:hypothetical protein
LSCGLPVDAPSEQPVVPGLEPTLAADAPAPPPETVPGLEPTRQPVGEVLVSPIPDVEPTRAIVPEVAVEKLPDLVTTEEALGRVKDDDQPPSRVVCTECGVPNPTSRKKCLACGKQL